MEFPEEIAVTGFGDIPFVSDKLALRTTVRIDGSYRRFVSTVRINGEQIGAVAAQFLIDRAENRPESNAIGDVAFCIIERESA